MKEYFWGIGASLIEWFADFLPNLMKGIVIALLGWYVSIKLRQFVRALGRRLQWENALTEYVAATVCYVSFAIFAIAALKKAGFPVASILAAAGISGVIIGLGLRAQIANYFAGVMMLAARPFRQGDLIEFGPPPQIGIVRQVCMTFTALDSLDNVRIIVPNAVLWRNRIFNFSTHQQRAIRIPITIPYDVNVEWVRDIALDVLNRHEAVANDPAPCFNVSDMTGTNIQALLVAWSQVQSMNVFGHVIMEMRKEFEVAGLEVTVPGKDVDLKREE